MRKRLLLIFILLILIASAFGYYSYREKRKDALNHPLKSNEKKINFKVKEGENLIEVIEDLNKKESVKNIDLLLAYIKKNNISKEVKVGEYSFSKDIVSEKFYRYLNKGILDDIPVKITIPEGYDIEKIAATFDKKGIISKDKFLESVKEYKLPSYIKKDLKRKYPLEGFLFPDTYEFLKGTSGKTIIDEMLARFGTIFEQEKKKSGKNIENQEIDKIVIMASVIEKEVEKPDERAKVASVFYNRLNKGMKLESCATVIYALGIHKDKLYYNDLKVQSPYNTYLNGGLPIGPISCPGRECLAAAINPEKTNYLFFVKKDDKSHFFTEDYNKFLEVKKVTQGGN